MTDQQSLAGKHILYVEDDKFLADLIIKKLKSLGAMVTNAPTAEKALEELKNMRPDVILLDLLLPEMSGFEFLETMRDTEPQADVPIVVFSNLGQQENVAKAQELGVNRFLVKANVVPDEVPGVVEELIGRGTRGDSGGVDIPQQQ